MNRNLVLHRISAFAFAMLPLGITLENKLWLGLIVALTILPLTFLFIAAIADTRRNKTSVLSNLFGFSYNYVDIIIACLGIAGCLFLGLNLLSLIWVVSLCCILLEIFFKRNRK